MEEKITLKLDGIELEAAFERVSGERGVVVTHPHPLYGGDMDNPVVTAVRRAYRDSGFSTLRFNFRGTGRSSGRFADGVGEQDDVIAALSYLAGQGIGERHLAGYSFGSWVNAAADTSAFSPAGMLMVAPPVDFMDFSTIPAVRAPLFIIAGSRDDIAPPERIRSLMKTWNPRAVLEVIQGADHFSLAAGTELETLIRALTGTPRPSRPAA